MPTKEIMDDFLKRVKSLEQDEKISAEAAIILRSKFATLDDVTKLSKNSLNNMTDKIALDATNMMLGRMYEKVTEEVHNEPEIRQLFEQAKQLEIKRKEVIDLTKNAMKIRNENVDMYNEIIKMEQYNEMVLQTILQLNEQNIKMDKKNNYDRRAIKREKQLVLTQKEELQKLSEKTERLALKTKKERKRLYDAAVAKANKRKTLVRKRLNVITILIAILLVVLFAIGTFLIADFTNVSLVKATIFVAVISILGVVITFKDLVKGVQFYINRISEKAGDKVYSEYIREYNQLSEDNDMSD